MHIALYERYFRHIHLNTNGYAPLAILSSAYRESDRRYVLDGFSRMQEHTLDNLSPVANFDDLLDHLLDPAKNTDTVYLVRMEDALDHRGKNLVVMFDGSPKGFEKRWGEISTYFGMWHSTPLRDSYKGVILINFAGNRLLLLSTKSALHMKYQSHGRVMPMEEFRRHPVWRPARAPSIVDKLVSKVGESCTAELRIPDNAHPQHHR